MNATFNPAKPRRFTRSHRKEGKCNFESYAALIPSTDHLNRPDLTPIVELRLYGTGSSWFAALWVHTPGLNTQGTGRAGGGGYHKPSAAAEEAIINAGFDLDKNIGGAGDSAIVDAVKAIAASLGHPGAVVYHAHQ